MKRAPSKPTAAKRHQWLSDAARTAATATALLLLVTAAAVALSRGWLEPLMPTGPSEPVDLQVYGPAECLAGGEYYFHLEHRGATGKATWQLIPETPNALTVFEDGARARFQSTETGGFSINVAIAGDAGLVAMDHIEFENLSVVEPEPEPDPAVAALEALLMQEQQAAATAAAAPPPPTVAQLTRRALDAVQTTDLGEEAFVIAGTIRALVARLETGLLPPETDVIVELASQIDHALGETASNWNPWLNEMAAIISTLRGQGHITTAASTIPTLLEIAAVLAKP